MVFLVENAAYRVFTQNTKNTPCKSAMERFLLSTPVTIQFYPIIYVLHSMTFLKYVWFHIAVGNICIYCKPRIVQKKIGINVSIMKD